MHCKYTYNREVPTVLYKEAFCAGNFIPLSSLESYWTTDNFLFSFLNTWYWYSSMIVKNCQVITVCHISYYKYISELLRVKSSSQATQTSAQQIRAPVCWLSSSRRGGKSNVWGCDTLCELQESPGAVTSLQHRAAPRSETGQSHPAQTQDRGIEMESSPRELLDLVQQSCRISLSCAPGVIAQVG